MSAPCAAKAAPGSWSRYRTWGSGLESAGRPLPGFHPANCIDIMLVLLSWPTVLLVPRSPNNSRDYSTGVHMKTLIRSMLAVTALAVTAMIASQAGVAQAPAGAPAGATGLCNDGSYWTGASKSGACRGHKGVKTWYASAAAPPAAAPAAAPLLASRCCSCRSCCRGAAKTKTATPASTTPAPGGGPGLVWLNTSTKVYHCHGNKVLRHNQGRRIYDRSCGQGQRRPPRCG